MRLFSAALAAMLLSSTSAAASVSVLIDQVRTITFDKPIAAVYVGNPSLADVTMIDPKHAFVLGKSFGTTNVIALDGKGAQVVDEEITVVGVDSTVTLNRGANQFTYACASSRCEAFRVPGDAKEPYDTWLDQTVKREELGTKAATTH